MNRRLLKLVFMIPFIGLVVFLLRFHRNQDDMSERESEWYVANLNYEFCAVVTDTEVLKQKWGYGYVSCQVANDVVLNTSVEDSLREHLHDDRSRRFIIAQQASNIRLVLQDILHINEGDSICVISRENRINIYRNGALIGDRRVTFSLYGRRFF